MNGNSYRLFTSLRSPFSRRIRLAIRRVQFPVEETFVDVFQEPPELNAANPMGAVPTLLTHDVGTLCDSNAILEYLHEKTNAIWPIDFTHRTLVRQASVLAMGITQATVLYFQEAQMHEIPSPRWMEEHVSVIQATLAHISHTQRELWVVNETLTQGSWDLVVGLEYLALRIPEVSWQKKYPLLLELIALARKNSFFVESTPKL